MIKLYYKDCLLGTLSYKNNEYIYSSSNDETIACENYIDLIKYDLQNCKELKSTTLFSFFKTEFLDKILLRPDILKKIGKNVKNDYEILEKFCKLNFDKFSFWLANN